MKHFLGEDPSSLNAIRLIKVDDMHVCQGLVVWLLQEHESSEVGWNNYSDPGTPRWHGLSSLIKTY
jgi:hypothetical protein